MRATYNGNSCKSGIYRITNESNGRIYIGSTRLFKARYSEHRSQLRNKRHQNKFLQADFNKCGEDVFLFEVIEVVDGPKEERWKLEEEYIARYHDNCKQCYNISRQAVSSEGHPPKNPEEVNRRRSESSKRSWAVSPYLKKMIKNHGKIISPEGEVFEVIGIRAFCEAHDIPKSAWANINRMLGGKIKKACYGGWRKYSPALVGVPYAFKGTARSFELVSPSGELVQGFNISKFCQENNLPEQSILRVLSGEYKSSLGWTKNSKDTPI